MNNHLTDRQLLDARFKLCTDAQAEAVNAHLTECADCRNRADALKRKFASLDLLRGDVSASKQLIAETLRQVRNEPEPKTVFLPRLGWLAGTAAAAALLLVFFFAGPIAKQPEPLAMTREAAAPAVQMAMKEETPAENANLPTASDIADKDVNEPAVEALVAGEEIAEAKLDSVGGQLAMAAPKPSADGGFTLKRSAVAMKAVRGFAAAPAAAPTEWSVSAPADVTVSVHSALVEFDPAVQKLKKGDGMTARQYSVQIINASPNTATAQITRSFGTTNWSVSISDDAVRVSTQETQNVMLSIEAPAQSTKQFHCTVILPAEPAKGVVP